MIHHPEKKKYGEEFVYLKPPWGDLTLRGVHPGWNFLERKFLLQKKLLLVTLPCLESSTEDYNHRYVLKTDVEVNKNIPSVCLVTIQRIQNYSRLTVLPQSSEREGIFLCQRVFNLMFI